MEAERLIEALTAALREDGHKLLTEADNSQLTQALETLKQACTDSDAEIIRQQIEHVNKLSDHFAAKRMDSNIKKALAGRHLNEFDDINSKPIK